MANNISSINPPSYYSTIYDRRNSVSEGSGELTVNQKVGRVYAYTAAAVAATSASAVLFSKTSLAITVLSSMVTAPIMSAITLTGVAVALIAGTILTPRENAALKHGCYGLFAVYQGLVLSPLVLINASAFAVATFSATALTGGLGAAAMNMKQNFAKYERILMVALGAIAAASLGALLLPASAAAVAHQVSLVGGIALFSAFVIYDTQKAREAADKPGFDPINHSLSIYLDVMNLVVRIWEVYQSKK